MDQLELLLVEDSPADVRLIHEALKDAASRLNISVAHDGVEAMEHLHLAESGAVRLPDLVLLDLNLPRKNGREVLRDIKSSPSFKQIPVLVMTSSAAEDDVTDAYELNANCFITKPSDLGLFMRTLRAIEDFWFLTATLPRTLGRSSAASVGSLGRTKAMPVAPELA